MTPPNLFKYATSELSQDAFLCWLLAWADQDHAQADHALHTTAVDFVEALLRKCDIPLPGRSLQVQVLRQENHIDVVALIGKDIVLAIEDKCQTQDHSEQLPRYRTTLAKEWSERRPARVYLKTGDQSDYARVEGQRWATFTRPEMMAVLDHGDRRVQNAIFCDFLDHLKVLERDFQAYRTTVLSQWSPPAWRGFYHAIRECLEEGGWGYVPNPTGGFTGFWWCWNKIPGGQLYLQLEEGNLVVKVDVPEKDRRSAIRDEWSRRVIEAKPLEPLKFTRPRKFGHGHWMTVATHGEYRSEKDGLLDLEGTIATLRSAMVFVKKLAGEADARA